jgi:hypothetical protein
MAETSFMAYTEYAPKTPPRKPVTHAEAAKGNLKDPACLGKYQRFHVPICRDCVLWRKCMNERTWL